VVAKVVLRRRRKILAWTRVERWSRARQTGEALDAWPRRQGKGNIFAGVEDRESVAVPGVMTRTLRGVRFSAGAGMLHWSQWRF